MPHLSTALLHSYIGLETILSNKNWPSMVILFHSKIPIQRNHEAHLAVLLIPSSTSMTLPLARLLMLSDSSVTLSWITLHLI